jgi:23S rRNA (adenine2503-C2)-methyltransferase
MNIIARTEDSNIATVYIGLTNEQSEVEFVESVQPPIPLEKKWVLIISTMKGCPVGCRFCDAGSYYEGKLSKNEIIEQIDHLIRKRFPDGNVPVEKFKVQFARMGDPAFNMAVIDVLRELPEMYNIPGFLPSVSTIAPNGTDKFFRELLTVKSDLYHGRFQLQFSIHSTNNEQRDWLIPVKKWSFANIAKYAEKFYSNGDKKISLNFALSDSSIIETEVLRRFFTPEIFLIKVTPVNPTYISEINKIGTMIKPDGGNIQIVDQLREVGYQVIVSIGEWEENKIGSNCGQHILKYRNKKPISKQHYSYELQICE